MRRFSVLVVIVSCAAARSVVAQPADLAARVARAPEGELRLEYESRAGACGDGREVIGFRKALFTRDLESIGEWSGARCVPGSVRVTLTKRDGQITRVRTQVGGTWENAQGRTTSLGIVAPPEASSYLLSLVPNLERAEVAARDRLLLPVALANDPAVVPALVALAESRARADRTRREAIRWVGMLGDARVVPVLVALARDDGAQPARGDENGDDEAPGKKGLANAAVAALSMLEGNVGVPSLIDLARTGRAGTRHAAVFWLGQNGDPRALRTLHSVIEDSREESRVRAHAIFSLGQATHAAPEEAAYLRGVYQHLDADVLKEAVFQAVAEESDGGQWLMARARDAAEPERLRRSALFWAGQRTSTPTADLVGFYHSANQQALREHALFVLSQRQDTPAVDALLQIARSDADTRMRGRALFWLAQRHDPRVTKLISDLVAR